MLFCPIIKDECRQDCAWWNDTKCAVRSSCDSMDRLSESLNGIDNTIATIEEIWQLKD
jgi:hypothetical protein